MGHAPTRLSHALPHTHAPYPPYPQHELEEHVALNAGQAGLNDKLRAELTAKADDVKVVAAESARVHALRERVLPKIASLEKQKGEVDDERDRLKREVLVVEDSIEVERKERESERKVVDDLVRERDILNKNLVKMVSATQAQADVLKIHENSKRNLEVEIASYRSATLATARTVKKLRAERDRYAGEAVEAVEKFAKAQSEVKAREVTAVQLQVCVASHHTPHSPISPTSDPTSDPKFPHLQHKIVEGEAKMKQQQNLYEAVRSDRNLYSKNLIESQDEIAEMKRKFKIMTRQVSRDHHHTPSPPHMLTPRSRRGRSSS